MTNKSLVRWAHLTASQQKTYGNGCGPGGFLGPLICEWTFNASCRRHDLAYGRGGTESDRRRADWLFYKNMRNDAAMHAMPRRICYNIIALVYFCAVFLFGWYGFDYGPAKSLSLILAEDANRKKRGNYA